jgi:6-phosphogluconolactonase
MTNTFPSSDGFVCRDPDRLAVLSAMRILRLACDAIAKRGRFRIALAGGSTPERTYDLLNQPDQLPHERPDWSKVDVFFSDERMVPLDDSRSNFGMANRSLLTHIPAATVFPVPTGGRPADCAAVYSAILAKAFGVPGDGLPPQFDLILLGLGDDGHTASLFPGAAALHENKAWVTWSPPGTLPPPVDRITFTFPTLNAAREVLFMVAGAKKAEALRDVLAGAPVERRPAAGVHPTAGKLFWLVDQEAASLLEPSTPG